MRQIWIFAAAALATVGCLQAQNRALSAGAQRQISGLLAEKAARTPAQQKMSSHLVHAAKILRRQPVHPDYPVPPDAIASVRLDAQNRVTVDMNADVTPELLAAIGNAGGTVFNSYPEFRALRARLPLLAVEQVASRGEVRQVRPAERFRHASHPEPAGSIRPDRATRRRAAVAQLSRFFRRQPPPGPPALGGMFRRLGSAFFVGPDISGDVAHQAGVVRNTFGFNGAGVKIGVMSDGVDSLAFEQAAGRLPAVTVLDAGTGDEGTAILEIVYTLAPGASLYYATAITSRAAMAANIQALADAGCNIILDDIGYFSEGVYQDDILAQKVNQVTAAGVFYFSAAGNQGNLVSGTSGTWEGDFADSHTTLAALPKSGAIHSFGGVNNNTLTRASDNSFYVLAWSDPLGHASNDYDLFVLNPALTSVIASSTNVQNGSQDPFEYIDDVNSHISDGSRIVVLNVNGAAAQRSLYLNTEGGALSVGTNGAIYGHSAASGAIAVAATDAHNANGGAFTGGPANPVEDFSSDGPRRRFYNPDGTAITPGNLLTSSNGGRVVNKPDLTAADGVTTGVRGFHTFYGTSAAAPHAAAIAALVKQASPAITPAQLRPLLAGASLDIGSPGYDLTSGSGILMAPAAVGSLFGGSVQVTITSAPVTGLGFTVSGSSCTPGTYTSPATLTWSPGASCTVQWDSPQFLNAFTEYSFIDWLNGGSTNPQTITAPLTATTYTGVFVSGPPPAPVAVTVTSVPAGLRILADSVSYTTPHTFGWLSGSNHTLNTAGTQTLSGTAYAFMNWSNGGSRLQTVKISAAATYTANFSAAKTGALAQVAAGGPYTTGILVLNTGTTAAQLSVRFYDDQGNPASLPFSEGSANALAGQVPPLGSAYYETGDPQIATLSGWGQIASDPNIVIQALFRNNVNGAYYEAAVPSTPGGKEFLIPFDATTFATTGQPFVTGIAIANLDAATANVTCTAHDVNGVTIPNAVAVPALAPLGHWADYQFPALIGQRGTIGCISNTSVSATALRFLGSELSSLPVVTNAASAGGSAQTGALAEIAAGGSYTTGIFVLNTGTAAASFSIQFYDNDGATLVLPFSAGSASTISGTVPAEGSAYYEASDPQISTLIGSGQFSADSSIVIQALFRNNVNGAFYEAAVPSTVGSKEFLIPFDATTFSPTGQPLVTGFAIANLDSTSANVICVARDPSGAVIPNAVTIPSLAPLGHWADYQFPALNGQRGTIDCVSNTRVSATALRFLGSAFSSLPVVTK